MNVATLAFVLLAATPQQEVRAVLDEWLAALKANDLQRVEHVLAQDYRITVADGRVLNREEDLAPIRDHTVTFDSAEATDVDIRIFGDTAIVTGLAKFDIRVKDRASSIQERFTDIYVKLNGRWQPVASHSTPIKR